MKVEFVIVFENCCHASLCGDRVAPHRVNFGDYCHVKFWVVLGRSDGGSESSCSTSDDENIVAVVFHRRFFSSRPVRVTRLMG